MLWILVCMVHLSASYSISNVSDFIISLYVLIMLRTRFRMNPNWSVWLNGWVFVYELGGCGFESRCSHINFRYLVCLEQGVPWHSSNYRVLIHSETRTWHDKNIQRNDKVWNLSNRIWRWRRCRYMVKSFLSIKVFQNNLLVYSIKFLIKTFIVLNPAGIYLFKVNNRNTRTRWEICSKLTINTPERRQWRRSGVFIVNFEHISHLVLVFLLLTLSR